MSDISTSDYALMSNNAAGNSWNNNPFIYLIWLMFLRNWSNDGTNNAATQGALTRAELADGLNFQTMNDDLSNIRTAISDNGSIVQSVGAGISDKICSGFNATNTNIMQSGNAINAAIAQASFANQSGICEINRNIDSVRYELAQNLGMLTNTIHAEGEATRQALIDQQIQDLRDSRESVQRELQSAQLTLANAAQTQNILGSIGRYVPYAGCGSTCGCSSW